jgi:hypothetical protein
MTMTDIDYSHLHALSVGLSHERARLANARSDGERSFRQVWVKQYENEVAAEEKRIGVNSISIDEAMSDDDLLAELMA